MNGSFSRLQIIFLLLMTTGISNHVFIIPHLIQDAGRDAWISILLTYPVLIGWSVILYMILKSMGDLSLGEWLERRIGRGGLWIFTGMLAIYFLILGLMIIYDLTKNVHIYFLPRTPKFVTIFSFVLVAYGAARKGIKTVIYMSIVLLPLVWLLGIGISLSTMDSKDYGMMLPMLEQGIGPGLKGGIIVFGGSVELLVLLLIQHKMNKPVNFMSLFVLIALLIWLTVGPTMGSIAAFGPADAGNMRFPAFEQWRLATIGRYVSRVDFLAVFQMLSGCVARAALMICLWSELVGRLIPKYRQAITICGTALMSLPSFLRVSDIVMQNLIHHYFYVSASIFGVVFSVVLFALIYFPQRKVGTKP